MTSPSQNPISAQSPIPEAFHVRCILSRAEKALIPDFF